MKERYVYQRGLLDEVALQMLYTASSKPIEERINFKNLDQYLKSGLVDNGIDLGYHFKVIDRDGREVYVVRTMSMKVASILTPSLCS